MASASAQPLRPRTSILVRDLHRFQEFKTTTKRIDHTGRAINFPSLDSTIGGSMHIQETFRPFRLRATTANFGYSRRTSPDIWGDCIDVPQTEALVFDRSFRLEHTPQLIIHNFSKANALWSYVLFDDDSTSSPISHGFGRAVSTRYGVTARFPENNNPWSITAGHRYVFAFRPTRVADTSCGA
jgi:hypothetical protein